MATGALIIPFPTLKSGEIYKSASSPVTFQNFEIADDDQGIAETVAYMNGLAVGDQGSGSPLIQQAAQMITAACAAADQECQRNAIFDWVKANIKFQNEEGELLQTPLSTMYDFRYGDCDDHSLLIAALLMSLGHQIQFRTVGVNGDNTLVHVYPLAYDTASGQWVALDTTVSESYPGWEAPSITRIVDHGVITAADANGNTNFRMAGLPGHKSRLQGLRGLRSLGDDNCGDGYFYDSSGNCQPISFTGDVLAFAQAFQPYTLPFVNAAAYKQACGVGPAGLIDPNCVYNPNPPSPIQNTNRFPALTPSGFASTINSSTVLLGAALLLGVVIVTRGGKRGR